MINAIHQLVNVLPARPRATIQRLVPATRPAPTISGEPLPTEPRRLGLWARWFDVLGPDFELSDIDLNAAEIDADLRRGKL
ncbi:MAG: hypothetical protein CVU56_14845 [Deltaproteobacteria bacterium HGW-Deltaproteobacteria-14]|jgi:hypothetical protein|nr:MAG: hypothetical protein CVU56_14845 [Deltaproteobacteria bacterium HGW-Deltaproteobacteria-14]